MGETDKLKTMALGLLGLLVVFGLIFIVSEQFKQTICEDIGGSTYTASSDTCAVQSRAFNVSQDVETAMLLVVSFLTIIILVMIVKLLISNVRGMGGE